MVVEVLYFKSIAKYINENERTATINQNIEKSHKHNVNQRKPDTLKKFTSYCSILCINKHRNRYT